MKYHWNIFKTDDKSSKFALNQDFYFKVSPENGFFEPGETKPFILEYNSLDYIPVYEYASLFIDDIPLQSIRNPPESLRK